MKLRGLLTDLLLLTLVVSLVGLPVPGHAAGVNASLAGSIVRATDRSPLAGARFHASDPKTGRIYSSAPADEAGSFARIEVPPSTYLLAVESEGGLYTVETPLAVEAGATRTLNLAVSPRPALAAAADDDDSGGALENPLAAALISLGFAALLGGLLWGDSGDSKSNSPTMP